MKESAPFCAECAKPHTRRILEPKVQFGQRKSNSTINLFSLLNGSLKLTFNNDLVYIKYDLN